ncbi:MAG: NADPH-dependent 2,4-dienoyl-CoA reductase, partial [Crocinitomicaceae bacterium]|nr:NADPH-dependent 2,4-dienoyl-CoA reductase [Crocinitomicaceae bacterium]
AAHFSSASGHNISLLQRTQGKPGSGLGKTTVWAHRKELANLGVKFLDGVVYKKINDEGLHIMRNGKSEVLPADHIVICAGQESENELYNRLRELGQIVHIAGGAKFAGEVNAMRAIEEGTRIGMDI